MSTNRSSLLGSQLKAQQKTSSQYENGIRKSILTTAATTPGHIRTIIAPLKDSSDSLAGHIRTLIAPLKDASSAASGTSSMHYSKSLGTEDDSSRFFDSSSYSVQRRSSEKSPSSMSFSGYLLKRSNHPFSFPVEVTTTTTAPVTSSSNNTKPMVQEFPSVLPKRTTNDCNTEIVNMDDGRNMTTEEEYTTRSQEAVMDVAASMAAAFFGVMEEEELFQAVPNSRSLSQFPPPPTVNITSSPQMQRKSTQPMPLPKRSPTSSSEDLPSCTNITIHRTSSSPDTCPTPADYVDPVDGHIWRAKFCVLENGILYFYRHVTDAYSPEAKKERCSTSLFIDPQEETDTFVDPIMPSKHDFLSKSPMPRNYMYYNHQTNAQPSQSQNLQESFHDDPNIIWEKKVSLDSVGAVRSVEVDFGQHSFVLLTEDDSMIGGTDCLILKAASQEDMQEWLFQFHCTLATFMRHIVKTYIAPLKGCGTHLGSNWVEQHSNHHHITRKSSFDVLPTSTLSHGHGRVPMMRKMRAEKRSRGTVTSSLGGGDISPALSVSPREMIHTPPTSYESYPSSFSTKVLEQHQSIVIVPQLEPESLPAVVKPKKKYIPPHLRKNFKAAPPSSTEKESTNPKSILSGMFDTTDDANTNTYKPKTQTKPKKEIVIASEYQPHPSLKLGGCADTTLFGSILETIHQQSILVQQPTTKIIYPYKSNAYGDFSPSKNTSSRWEVGAVSERGVREANEDAFLICNDLASFDTTKEKEGISTSVYPNPSSLFAIFDGHCGDQGARYAAETFTTFLQESILLQQNDPNSSSSNYAMEEALKHAIYRLDTSLCTICQEGGRDWGCGATALITLVLEDKLILANVGDCRGVFCTSTLPPETSDWNELPHTSTNGTTTTNTNPHKSYHWKSITKVHTPSRPSEKTRIEEANGWITVEHESCLAGQLHRMDFCDDDVVNILKRWFSDRFDIKNDTNGHADADNANCERSADSADPKRILKISRVCGELSVSRALGDCDFKAAFNPSTNNNDDDNTQHKSSWEGPDFLPYPKTHSQRFHDDLISGIPDVETMTIIPGFLILACDGLWDVMDPYDAVRVTKDLIYDKGWNAKKAAARLAELAIHLGSSDNTTVILIRFYDCEDNTDNCASTNEVKCNR